MATFVKLTSVSTGNRPVWVNLELVRRMERRAASSATEFSNALPERTIVWFDRTGPRRDDWDFEEVLETPQDVLRFAGAVELGGL